MVAMAVTAFQVAAALGFGALVLRALGLCGLLRAAERWAVAFVIGCGMVGWLVFPLGVGHHLTPLALLVLLGLGLPGLAFLGPPPRFIPHQPLEWALSALLAGVLALSLLGAMPPPTDADSMAYHFYLPRIFVQNHGFVFEPRAVDGAVPLLTQMTYVPVLALGGERAMTLWTAVSGWSAPLLAMAWSRRWLPPSWALVLALVALTTPTMIYGAGSGQVEARTAAQVVVCALGLSAVGGSARDGWRWAVLAGLAAGFFVGSKYLGLLLAAAGGVPLLLPWFRLRAVLAYGIAALVAGGQWYGWNFAHTGDPLFPLLYKYLPSDPYWTAAHDAVFKVQFYDSERALPQTIGWMLAYPLWATLFPPAIIESGRVGLGPLGLLLAPLAVAGLWLGRRRLFGSPLLAPALLVLSCYLLWWFTSSSQRVRHLLPLWPVLLLCLTVATHHLSRAWSPARALAWAAFAFTLGIQGAILGVFSLTALGFVLASPLRQDYLDRFLPDQKPLADMATMLDPRRDKVLIHDRHTAYHAPIPVFIAQVMHAPIIDLRQAEAMPGRYYRQMRDQGVTHVLSYATADSPRRSVLPADAALQDADCAEAVRDWRFKVFVSRTLPDHAVSLKTVVLLKLSEKCRLSP